jgi:trans-aconitate methyltransferase
MKRISEDFNLMSDVEGCNLYNQSLINSYDLIDYVRLYKNYFNLQSGKIADLGSGPCNFVIALCLEFPELTFDCYENSDVMISLAEENIKAHNLSDRITIIKGDLLLASGKYDGVLINRVLHHIDDTTTLWKTVHALSNNVFVVDLERPENIESLADLFNLMKAYFDEKYIADTTRSFMAAYTKEEVDAQVNEYGYKVESLSSGPDKNVRYNKLIIYHTR